MGASKDQRELILASKSPRRRELLQSAGVRFRVEVAAVEESIADGEEPRGAAKRLAMAKAIIVAARNPAAYVLGADTMVILETPGGSEALGKPRDAAEAREMLLRLAGRAHIVVTAFALVCQELGFSSVQLVETRVVFRGLSPQEIEYYAATGEPLDKAGAYGAQGRAAFFVREVHGSHTSVIGLPLAEVVAELERLGLWNPADLTLSQ